MGGVKRGSRSFVIAQRRSKPKERSVVESKSICCGGASALFLTRSG
jgi:hypothetical protein